MLNVYFGDMPGAIFNTAVYFKNTYRDSWITNPLSVQMIKDVDKSDVVSESVIESPVLGSITPLARKVVINLHHVMDFGKGPFKIKVLNNGKTVSNMDELLTATVDCF